MKLTVTGKMILIKGKDFLKTLIKGMEEYLTDSGANNTTLYLIIDVGGITIEEEKKVLSIVEEVTKGMNNICYIPVIYEDDEYEEE